MESKLVASQFAAAESPSLSGAVIFNLKARAHQARRTIANVGTVRRYRTDDRLRAAPIIAESRSPLFSAVSVAEAPLVAGKVHNLRLAIAKINGIEIPAGAVFSFWSQIGKPTARRGFVNGRELREGCIIPAIGGGLCQLSNALYQCALASGSQILERHAHSAVVPGSLAELGGDATVFWNYVDLRFAAAVPLRIEATLAAEDLVVAFKGTPQHQFVNIQTGLSRTVAPAPSSCATCGKISCFRNAGAMRGSAGTCRTAFLVDECWPEYKAYVSRKRKSGDVIGLPLDSHLGRTNRYGWDTREFGAVRSATLATLSRSLALRTAGEGIGVRQELSLKHDQRLARSLAASLTFDVSHVVVSQNLLPFLWRKGHLGGRTFDVLMTRLPMSVLHERLDRISELHPDSTTARQFRAEPWLVQAEAEALQSATNIITPNSDIAEFFPERAIKLPWTVPRTRATPTGRGILFPASALARKGAYEVREAVAALGIALIVAGPPLERRDFWDGVKTLNPREDVLDGIGLVVLPAYVEDKPRLLLQAVARRIPVVVSRECGLAGIDGVDVLGQIGAASLIQAITRHISDPRFAEH
ncbi:MAG TPA: VanW family protein [Blastocatellia bacterium]